MVFVSCLSNAIITLNSSSVKWTSGYPFTSGSLLGTVWFLCLSHRAFLSCAIPYFPSLPYFSYCKAPTRVRACQRWRQRGTLYTGAGAAEMEIDVYIRAEIWCRASESLWPTSFLQLKWKLSTWDRIFASVSMWMFNTSHCLSSRMP